jgi:hypothetical protein
MASPFPSICIPPINLQSLKTDQHTYEKDKEVQPRKEATQKVALQNILAQSSEKKESLHP